MIEKNTKAWVLRIYDRAEDSVVTLFTEEGNILNLRAVGIQRVDSKNRLALQLFSIVDVEYFQSTNQHTGRLKRASIVETIYTNKINDLNTLNLLKNLVMSYKKLNRPIFDAVMEILDKIVIGRPNIAVIFFIAKAIIELENVKLKYNECATCGSKIDIVSFSLYEGGLICKKCMTKHDYVLTVSFMKKIIQIIKAEKFQDVLELSFTPIEEKKLKQLFSTYLYSSFGLFTDLMTKI